MAIDERRWLELWDAARSALGEEPALTLMELLRAVAREDEARDTDPVVRYGDLQWALIDVLGPLLNARFSQLGRRIDDLETRERIRQRTASH